MKSAPLLSTERKAFHRALREGILTTSSAGVPNIADKASKTSITLAKSLLAQLGVVLIGKKGPGQTSGKDFEEAVADFLRTTFLHLSHLRPGAWEVRDRRSGSSVEISNFEQYDHLARLMEVIEGDPQIASSLGSDYLITPDVVILRKPESEEVINAPDVIADQSVAVLTPLRKINRSPRVDKSGRRHDVFMLHASISCKWTLRSDRAQNARSEALNLIRNRKGRAPHIVAVTAEPLPTRIASLALGTSDLDCVYHIALPELQEAISKLPTASRYDQEKQLQTLVLGKRLRDIADLPLDLAI
jgi:hypothetical protein